MQASLKIWVSVIGVLLLSVIVSYQSVQQSHVEGNVSDDFEEFQKILNRDLQRYFSQELESEVDIAHELLRRVPTQSGVAYPKFYAWVEVLESGQKISAGAVRVAAIDKERVEVTHYFSEEKIRKDPQSVEMVFPFVLCDEIRIRAGVR